MNKGRRFSLTAEEIAFIGGAMADLLERSRKPCMVEEMIEGEKYYPCFYFSGEIKNYDWRYGSKRHILNSL